MIEPKKDELMRAPQVADLDPYNTRGQSNQEVARELIGEEVGPTDEGLQFTEEQKRALEEEGFRIYTLSGESIETLMQKGFKFWDTSEVKLIKSDKSRIGQVAIGPLETKLNPDNFFISDTRNKTKAEQSGMIEKFSKSIGNRISGTKAILGEAADYIELAFQNKALFSQELPDMFYWTMTNTIFSAYDGVHDIYEISVGEYTDSVGLRITSSSADSRNPYRIAIPLVVPDYDRT